MMYHPYTMPSGAATIVDKNEMDSLLDRLHNGDSTLGWEGDPNFALAYHRPTQRWELWRKEADSQYRLAARSKPGLPFPGNIIQYIMEHDTQRGFDPHRHVMDHNAKLDKENNYKRSDKLGEAASRLQWALRKDTRTGAGI